MNHQETMTDYLMAFIEGLKIVGLNKQSLVQGPGPHHWLYYFIGKPQSKLLSMSMNVPLLFALGLSKASQNQWSYFVPLEQQLQTIIQQFVKPILAMCL